jgi:hypothetical protein
MGLFKKKPDPISDKERVLNTEIAALEAEIQRLSAAAEGARNQPCVRSTALPDMPGPSPVGPAPAREPIFEPVDQALLKSTAQETSNAPGNGELGIRKAGLAALWRRLQNQFRAPPPNNPKLVSYLAAGSIQGLRPLRYEKRVARMRFVFLCICLALALSVICYLVFGHR